MPGLGGRLGSPGGSSFLAGGNENGNIVRPDDANCMAVVQYAVDYLEVSHLIVTGHYHCGGVQAALGPAVADPLEGWIAPIRGLLQSHAGELASLPDADARLRRLCELNVQAQVRALSNLPTVINAWSRGQPLAIHGWVYDLRDGLLRDLDVTVMG